MGSFDKLIFIRMVSLCDILSISIEDSSFTIVWDGGILHDIHVRLLLWRFLQVWLTRCRWIMKISDPFLGPKGVRWLLALRGFFGSVYTTLLLQVELTLV